MNPLISSGDAKITSARSLVLHAGKCHRVSRNEMLRILDPFVERIVVPDDAGRLERGRVTREARQGSGLSVPNLRQTRAGHVPIRLERMAGNAGAVHALAA